MNIKKEIKEVETLGKKIGYGHLMQLASALWRNKTDKDTAYICASYRESSSSAQINSDSYVQIIKDNL